ncbi:hypothetical protein V4F39_03275 [Aquincola sp. MAHUQ-54]|uniref:Uncharacterized protein n=1 Tax=Aquincola agrisoli TaxID=3119538 RepID=A0AAW9Q9R8_9BURK
MDTLHTPSSPAAHPVVVQELLAAPPAGADEWMTDALRQAIANVNAWHWEHEQLRLQSMSAPLS